ncbi:hypothetical protein J2S09_005108 [Bacillus fengqiuensis]|nr:hypothetical protein [Bacillus fengqiuensis]
MIVEVNASYHILSDINGVLTVAICINGEIGVIVAGQTETILIKLKNIFKER